MGLERGPLSLVSTSEELLERRSNGCGLESREYGHRDMTTWHPLSANLALTSPSRTQATEFVLFFYWRIVPAPDDNDECGAVGGMIGRGNRSTRKKPAPVPICPPQFSHYLTRAAAVGRRGLTA
jgi:hypothetical protein